MKNLILRLFSESVQSPKAQEIGTFLDRPTQPLVQHFYTLGTGAVAQRYTILDFYYAEEHLMMFRYELFLEEN